MIKLYLYIYIHIKLYPSSDVLDLGLIPAFFHSQRSHPFPAPSQESPGRRLRVALHVSAELLPGLVVHVRQAADLHLGAVADLPGSGRSVERSETKPWGMSTIWRFP